METKIEEIIKDISKIIKENKKEINKTGKGFNLISILGMEENERYTHSNIIAELLKQNGTHPFGNKFFELFLNELKIKDFSISNYEVITEEYVGLQLNIRTFLDIVIKDKTTEKVILIENKIWAEDQPMQIERYYEAYKGKILKLFYLNVNEWSECPTKPDGIQHVFENISYKTNIKNWLEKCIEISFKKPFISTQIEVYKEIILKISNQDIYKKMKIEIENRIIESFESFETAIEIEKYITNFKDEKKEEFRTKIKKSIENGSFTLLDKVIHYEIVEDKEDFIFLGFTLINTNDYENNSINYEDIKELLSKIFGKKSNGYFLGWVNSINENDTNDLYRLCKNVDSLVEEVKDRFNGVINDVKKIVDNYNRSH